MTEDQFIPQNYLPLDYYPWPNLINPHVGQMKKDMDSWIDDYAIFQKMQGENIKRWGFIYVLPEWLPKRVINK